MRLSKEEFIASYVTSFLATYAAQEYTRNCQLGWPDSVKQQPVEDAAILAKEAWDQFDKWVTNEN